MTGGAVSPAMEIPTRAQVLAGESLHYGADGDARAVCVRCGAAIDLQHDAHYEVSMLRRLGIVAEGSRWFWCGDCSSNQSPAGHLDVHRGGPRGSRR